MKQEILFHENEGFFQHSLRLEPFIPCAGDLMPHSDLSEMAGTTRRRSGTFLKKFQFPGLVGLIPQRFFLVEMERLRDYLMSGICREVESFGVFNLVPRSGFEPELCRARILRKVPPAASPFDGFRPG